MSELGWSIISGRGTEVKTKYGKFTFSTMDRDKCDNCMMKIVTLKSKRKCDECGVYVHYRCIIAHITRKHIDNGAE